MKAAQNTLINFQAEKEALETKPISKNLPLPSAYFGTIAEVSPHLLVKYADKVFPAQSLVAVQVDDIGQRCALMFEEGDPTKPLIIGLLWEPDKTPTDERIETTASLTLKCGQASLVLEADGTVRLKGLTITTQAYGANRIKGGSVRIN